ncbi:MAG: HAD-IA family hydrolase [Gemmatimonadota bacterium]|jgi:putative hydrolase of the HAD superfamily
MDFEAVFLDAGGTLIHPDRSFILKLLADCGVKVEVGNMDAAERSARDLLRSVLLSESSEDDATRLRIFWDAFVRSTGCPDAAVEGVVKAIMERHRDGRLWVDVEDGTEAALRTLRGRGYTLGVVSNADGRVESFLELAGLRRYLDFVVDSAVVGVEKPDPGIFRIALERAGVEPPLAVHVGDIYEIDVVGARAAGVQGILLDPSGTEDTDAPSIRSLAELPAWLADHAQAATD